MNKIKRIWKGILSAFSDPAPRWEQFLVDVLVILTIVIFQVVLHFFSGKM